MNNVNLVVMGKTGAGKSTLINAVLEEDLAPTGTGQAVTKKNQLYWKLILLLHKRHYVKLKVLSKKLNSRNAKMISQWFGFALIAEQADLNNLKLILSEAYQSTMRSLS